MIEVLKFVRDQIHYFRGDRNNVNLVGHDAGAMAAGLLTVSPKARGKVCKWKFPEIAQFIFGSPGEPIQSHGVHRHPLAGHVLT
jgi:acetyl esterase/lipase